MLRLLLCSIRLRLSFLASILNRGLSLSESIHFVDELLEKCEAMDHI